MSRNCYFARPDPNFGRQAEDPTPEQQRITAIKERAAATAAQQVEIAGRAKADFGITKGAAISAYGQLEQASAEGLIDDAQFADMAGSLAGEAHGLGAVRKSLNDARRAVEKQQTDATKAQEKAVADAQKQAEKAAAAQQKSDDAAVADAAKQVQAKAEQAQRTEATLDAGTQQALANIAARKTAVAPVEVAAPAAKLPDAPATAAPERAVETPKPVASQEVSPGATAIAKFEQYLGKKFTPIAISRLYTRLGFDAKGNPTGAGMRTLEEVAAVEAARTGKPAPSRQAIDTMLRGYKLNDDTVEALYGRLTGSSEVAQSNLQVSQVAAEDGTLHETADEPVAPENTTVQLSDGQDQNDVVSEGEVRNDAGMGVRGSLGSRIANMGAEDSAAHAVAVMGFARELKGTPELAAMPQAVQAAVIALADAGPRANSTVVSKMGAKLSTAFKSLGDTRRAEAFATPSQQEVTAKTKAVVAEQAQFDADTSAQEAANAAIIAANEKVMAEINDDVANAGELQTLLNPRLHDEIDRAAGDWADTMMEGDTAWNALSVPSQAQWVRAFSSWDKGDITDRQYNQIYDRIQDDARKQNPAGRQSGEDGSQPATLGNRPAGENAAPGRGADKTQSDGAAQRQQAGDIQRDSAPGETAQAEQAQVTGDGSTSAATVTTKKKRTIVKPGTDVRFSSEESSLPANPLSTEQVEQAVQQALAGIPNAPPVNVVSAPVDIGLSVPDSTVAYGVTVDGRDVYVFQSAMRSTLDVFKTVFHELFHRGVRALVPASSYVQIMLDLAKGDARIQQYAIDWKNSDEAAEQRAGLKKAGYSGSALTGQFEALAVEEGLAQVGEELRATGKLGTKPMPVAVRQIASWLARVADMAGMKKLAQAIRSMTYNEAEKFVMQAIDRSGDAAATPSKLQAGLDLRYSRTSAATEQAINRLPVPKPAKKALGEVSQFLLDVKENAILLGAFTKDLVGKAAARMPAAQKYFDLISAVQTSRGLAERNVSGIVEAYNKLDSKERGTGAGTVNALLQQTDRNSNRMSPSITP